MEGGAGREKEGMDDSCSLAPARDNAINTIVGTMVDDEGHYLQYTVGRMVPFASIRE